MRTDFVSLGNAKQWKEWREEKKLALHFSLRSKVALGGCIALSSWLPFRDDYPASLSPTAASLKIFQAHGDADNVVDHNWGFLSHSLLKTMIQQNEPKFLTIPVSSVSNTNLLMIVKFYLLLFIMTLLENGTFLLSVRNGRS